MDLMHCNACGTLQNERSVHKFIISNCGHIFCEQCGNEALSTETCKLCDKKCSFTPFGSKCVSESTKSFFESPNDLLKRVLEILQFQDVQHNSLLMGYKQIVQKYNDSNSYCLQLQERIDCLKKRVEDLDQQKQRQLIGTDQYMSIKATLNARHTDPKSSLKTPAVFNVPSNAPPNNLPPDGDNQVADVVNITTNNDELAAAPASKIMRIS